MKKFTWLLTIALVFIFAVSCGDSKKEEKETPDDNDTDEISDSDEDAEPAEIDDECKNFAEGLNENLIVGDLERSFYLRLPENVDSMEKVPVIFLYHGYGDSAANFEKLLSGYVSNETMPFILVVPESRGDIYGFNNIPPAGLDWDMMNLEDGSAEIEMFDTLLTLQAGATNKTCM